MSEKPRVPRGRPGDDSAADTDGRLSNGRKRGFLHTQRGNRLENLITLMHGFGDDPQPLRETAELLEELCVDYLVDLCQNAMESAGPGNTVMPQDLLFCLRKDKEKYTKAVNLLEESAKIDEGKKIASTKTKDLDTAFAGDGAAPAAPAARPAKKKKKAEAAPDFKGDGADAKAPANDGS